MYGRRTFCAGISEPWLQERFADEIWAFDMFQEKTRELDSYFVKEQKSFLWYTLGIGGWQREGGNSTI